MKLENVLKPKDVLDWQVSEIPEPTERERHGNYGRTSDLAIALERVMLKVVDQGYICIRKDFKTPTLAESVVVKMKGIAARKRIPVTIKQRSLYVYIINDERPIEHEEEQCRKQ